MKHRLVVAEAGNPEVPPSERIFTLPDFDRPGDERLKVEIEVAEDETLGSILRRAGEKLDRVGPHGAEPEPWAPTYFGIHVEGERTQMWNELTIRMGGAGDGFVSGFPEFIHGFHIWWELLKATYEAGGRDGLFRPSLRLGRGRGNGGNRGQGRRVAGVWRAAIQDSRASRATGGHEPRRPLPVPGDYRREARSLLEWFGSSEDSDGRWRVGEDEPSQLMARMVEFVLYGGQLTKDAFREAAQKFAGEFAETGKPRTSIGST